MSRAVIGMDVSLTGFAVCVLHGDQSYHSEKGTKSTHSLVGRVDRIRSLVDWAVGFVRKNVPELLLIEGYSYSSKGSSSITLGELGGVLRDEVTGLADRVVEVPPSLLKKFCTGKGNASKIQVATALALRYGEELETDNQYDAFGLAKLGQAVLGCTGVETAFQRGAVEVVKELINQEIQHEDAVRKPSYRRKGRRS